MKKFLNYFNIFELNLYSRSYKSPLIRIFVSLFLIIGLWVGRMCITIKNPVVNIISFIAILLIMIPSVLCFFVAMVEFLQVGDNIKKYKERQKDTERF